MNRSLGSLVSLLALAPVASAQFTDDFNRPNGTNLGPTYTENTGDMVLSGGKFGSASTDTAVATINGLAVPITSYVGSVDVSTGSGVNYLALVAGYLDSAHSVFVKVQSNSGGAFDHYAFYYGDNGSSSGGTYGLFGTLNSSFTSGRITLDFPNADTARLSIDTDFDTLADQVYTQTGVSGLALGAGAGIGAYGNALGDNLRVQSVPEPTSLAALGLGAIALMRRRRAR